MQIEDWIIEIIQSSFTLFIFFYLKNMHAQMTKVNNDSKEVEGLTIKQVKLDAKLEHLAQLLSRIESEQRKNNDIALDKIDLLHKMITAIVANKNETDKKLSEQISELKLLSGGKK